MLPAKSRHLHREMGQLLAYRSAWCVVTWHTDQKKIKNSYKGRRVSIRGGSNRLVQKPIALKSQWRQYIRTSKEVQMQGQDEDLGCKI